MMAASNLCNARCRGCSDVLGIALAPSFSSRRAASWLDKPPALASVTATAAVPSALEMKAAEEPEHEQDNYYDAQNAAQSGSAVTPISVVAAAATEQQQDYDNDQKQAHVTPSRQILATVRDDILNEAARRLCSIAYAEEPQPFTAGVTV